MESNTDEMSEASDVNTFPQRKPQRYGFLKFLREYGSKKYGMDLVEMSIKGGEAWSKLSSEEKEKYESLPSEPKEADDWDRDSTNEQGCSNDDFDDGCCPVPKRCKPKKKCCPQKRNPCCKPKPKCCRRKPGPKPCCKPKRKSCPPKPCCKPKPKCKPACQNPGPITNNGYLNFLRYYRRKHCGLKPRELVMKAARAWCRMPECKKDLYRRMARQCFPKKKKPCC